MSDDYEALTEFGKAIQTLSESSDSLAASFGELSDKSKAWTIASRILSGSGLWKLQNYVRAVGNTIKMYNDNQNEAAMATVKAFEYNQKLTKSYAEMEKQIQQVEKKTGSYYDMMVRTHGEERARTEGLKDLFRIKNQISEKLVGKAKGRIGSAFESAGAYFREGKTEINPITGEEEKVRNAFTGQRGGYFGKVMGSKLAGANTFATALLKGDPTGKTEKARRRLLLKYSSKYFKKMSPVAGILAKIPSALYRFINVGLTFFIQGLMYVTLIGLGIIVLVKILKKANIFGMFKELGEGFRVVHHLLEGFKQIFGGIFLMLKAVFKGNFTMFFTGLFTVLKGVAQVVVGVLLAGLAATIAIVVGLLIKLPIEIYKSIKKGITGRATGGIVRENMTLVGERGPELVSLPNGARVHTNAQSRRMATGGSNVINVNVTGRVGASDAEIRDIANKVAREINLRMNRTGSAAGRF